MIEFRYDSPLIFFPVSSPDKSLEEGLDEVREREPRNLLRR